MDGGMVGNIYVRRKVETRGRKEGSGESRIR